MECPYCAEEIKEQAVVCRHCRHDLRFFQPVMAKLSGLETRLLTIENSIDRIQKISPTESASPPVSSKSTAAAILFQLALSAGATIALFVWLRSSGNPPTSFAWLVSSCPLPFGISLGLFHNRLAIWQYVAAGALVGLLTFFGAVANVGSFPRPNELFEVAIGFAFGPVIVYTSAALVGRWLSTRLRSAPEAGLSHAIAEKWTSARTNDRSLNVNKLATVISSLGPLLALVGSLVTAYFSYLSALAKAKP